MICQVWRVRCKIYHVNFVFIFVAWTWSDAPLIALSTPQYHQPASSVHCFTMLQFESRQLAKLVCHCRIVHETSQVLNSPPSKRCPGAVGTSFGAALSPAVTAFSALPQLSLGGSSDKEKRNSSYSSNGQTMPATAPETKGTGAMQRLSPTSPLKEQIKTSLGFSLANATTDCTGTTGATSGGGGEPGLLSSARDKRFSFLSTLSPSTLPPISGSKDRLRR